MADKKNESVGTSETPNPAGEKQEVEAWLRTLTTTEKWRDEIFSKMKCKQFISEYKNDWAFLQQTTSVPIIPINLVYAYVKTEIARMYFRDPWITVNPKRVEDIGAAHIAEQIINYTWGELKLKNEVKLALLESLLVGHAWIKVGYVAEFGTVEAQPKEEKRGPGRPKKQEVVTNEYVKSENVFAYHVPYTDILFDPSATYPAPHNARWMAHKIVKPLRAIQASGIYEHTELLKPSSAASDPAATFSPADVAKESFGKDVKSVTLWEIYDLDNQKIITVSPGCPAKLREIQLPDYLAGGFPFVQIAFNPVPGEVYPLSDIAPHEGQIIELIKLVSIEMNHLKRWNRQLLRKTGVMAEGSDSKFKDAVDGAIIDVTINDNQSLADVVTPVPYAPVQSDIYGVFQQIFPLWQMVSGQTATDQGGQAKTQTRTLGELRLSLQGSKARPEEKIDTLEDQIGEVARKLLSIIQKKYDLPKIARIVGPKAVQEKILKILPQRPSAQPQMPAQPGSPPQPNPVAAQSFTGESGFSWTRTDILGEMDVDVLAGSTVPLDRESQLEIIEKMIPLLQLAGVQPGSPPAKAFLREVIRLSGMMSLETIMDLIDQLPPTPPPKILETQAKVQAKMMETKVKIQGQQQQQALKLQAMKEKLNMDRHKAHLDVQKGIVSSILEQFRPNGGNENGAVQE